jgi:microcystin-dependent protein
MTAYIGEVRIFGGNFAPVGWLLCQGQILQIAEYEALYSLLGTTYGGDGVTTFALPDLRSRLVAGQGQLPGGSNYLMGQKLGTETVTLNSSQLPVHNHALTATIGVPESGTAKNDPTGIYFGFGGANAYTTALGTNPGTLAPNSVVGQAGAAGGGQSHANIQPVLALNYIISTEGVYPSQP